MPSPTADAVSSLGRSRKQRPGAELACEYVFRPVAHVLVLALLPLRVPPTSVVVVHATIGLVAAALLAAGQLTWAAALVLAKTVLDNADGQLARLSGRVSEVGRYLDTELDAIVNVALFAALAHVTGRPWLALVGLASLTIVLSVDYNLEYLYRRERGEETRDAPREHDRGSRTLAALRRTYELVFGPQDRLLRRLSDRRLERVLAGCLDSQRRARARLAYNDRLVIAVVANYGLSTQLLTLAVCLIADVPEAYMWMPVGCLLTLPLLQLRRERLARRVVEGAE